MSLPTYWWFGGASLAAIRQDLNNLGPTIPEGARLRLTVEGDKGHEQLRAFVTAPGMVTPMDGGGTNDSHRCPPQC